MVGMTTTNNSLNWHAKRDGKGYWTQSPAGDEIVIWGTSKNREGFTVNVRGEVPAHGVTLAAAKAAAEAWVKDQQPKCLPVTAGAWSIDDAGNLWKDGEYIGRIVEEQRGSNGRTFYAQGVEVKDPSDRSYLGERRYLSIGASSARTISVEEHGYLSALVR